MDELNYRAEQQYLAGEREAEIKALMSDPEFYMIPCDMHADAVPACSGCQCVNGIKRKGASA